MQVSHVLPPASSASVVVFDEPNLIAHASLIPAMTLAEQAGLFDLLREHLRLTGTASAYSAEKVAVLVAGMLTGADSIEDMDVLRHGAMAKVFTELRAPSTLGTFLRSFTHGRVRQLDAVNSRLLANLQQVSHDRWRVGQRDLKKFAQRGVVPALVAASLHAWPASTASRGCPRRTRLPIGNGAGTASRPRSPTTSTPSARTPCTLHRPAPH